MSAAKLVWLRPEYCRGPLYTGWHLYLRENPNGLPNCDGDWGWVQRGSHAIQEMLDKINVPHPRLAYSMDTSVEIKEFRALVEWFARRYPLGIQVTVDRWPYPWGMMVARVPRQPRP